MCGFLELADLTQSDSSTSISMRLPDATFHQFRFARSFCASCLRGAFPPVDLAAVCFVRAISLLLNGIEFSS